MDRRARRFRAVCSLAPVVLALPFGSHQALAQDVVGTVPEAAYEDQYLLDGTEIYEPVATRLSQDYGRRQLEIESVYYSSRDDFFGDDFEVGTRTRWTRETGDWGTFDVEAQVSDARSTYLGRDTSGTQSLVTVRQSAMPISATSTFDAVVGHQRIAIDPLLHGGYRFRLPVSTILGMSSEIRGNGGSMRFATGTTGRYRGVRLPSFEDTGGRLLSSSYSARATELLEVGAQIVDVAGDDDTRDHTSLLTGMRRVMPDGRQEHAVRLLADGGGHIGLWSDSFHELAPNRTLRYGVFRFDPGLVWADQPMINDQQGVYLRTGTSNSRFSVSGGYDMLQTGLGGSSLSPIDAQTAHVDSLVRVRRDLTVGASARVGTRSLASVDDDQDILRILAYTHLNLLLGGLRLEIFRDQTESRIPGNSYGEDGLAATFDWRMPEKIRLSTELRLERGEDSRGSIRRRELSALFRYDLLDRVSLSLNGSLYATSGDTYNEDNGVSLSADVGWRFRPGWNASLTLNRNRARYDVGGNVLLTHAGEAGSTSLWLTVRYALTQGRAFPRLGDGQAGVVGTGRISGMVFFDANADSIRQPSEDVVVGAVVVLDGRYETRTDNQGVYTFSPVPAGEHTVEVVMDDLPLPWGLDDERPRAVTAQFRQTARIDFPLVVIE